jgi:hypothetical protein
MRATAAIKRFIAVAYAMAGMNRKHHGDGFCHGYCLPSSAGLAWGLNHHGSSKQKAIAYGGKGFGTG